MLNHNGARATVYFPSPRSYYDTTTAPQQQQQLQLQRECCYYFLSVYYYLLETGYFISLSLSLLSFSFLLLHPIFSLGRGRQEASAKADKGEPFETKCRVCIARIGREGAYSEKREKKGEDIVCPS